jgi:hypothetical protein
MNEDLIFPEASGKSDALVAFPSKMPTSKSQLKKLASETHVESDDVIETAVFIKATQEFLDIMYESIKAKLKDKVDTYHKEERVFNGVTVDIANTPAQYSFDHDQVWADLSDKLSEIKEKIKERESLMIAALNFSEVKDNDGNLVPQAAVKKLSAETVRITLPK